MDSDDGKDIRHYDSGEAIAASQQIGEEAPRGLRGIGAPGVTADDPRPGGGIDPDEPRAKNSAEGFGVGGTGAGIERGPDASAGPDDSSPIDDEGTADTYGEPLASLDFDPDSDLLGMATEDDDRMITGE